MTRSKGTVIHSAAMGAPARASCQASSSSSGPEPAMTVGAEGTIEAFLSSVCAAPAPITPGSVPPGIGTGRSMAPVAMMTRRARTTRASPPPTSPTSTPSPGAAASACQTPVSGRNSAPLASKRCTTERPRR